MARNIQRAEIEPHIKDRDTVISILQGNEGLEFNRNGFTNLRGEKTPSVSIRKDGYIKDFGGDFNGTLIDYYIKFKGMSVSEAINYIGYLVGLTDSTDVEVKPLNIPKSKPNKEPKRLSDEELTNRLENETKFYLRANYPVIGSLDELPCKECIKKRINFKEIVAGADKYIFIPVVFEKLFEGNYLETDTEVMNYLFNHIVGYSNIFSCPVIILRDYIGRVVDIAHYRPLPPSKTEDKKLPKYLYKSNEKKPLNRGKYFLYPFQKEMERLINKEEFLIVGEGLKNAVNALVYKAPYISLEGATNRPKEELLNYIKELEKIGKTVLTAFDGDEAGKRAFISFNNAMQRDYKNLFSFDSGKDFITHIKGGIQ